MRRAGARVQQGELAAAAIWHTGGTQSRKASETLRSHSPSNLFLLFGLRSSGRRDLSRPPASAGGAGASRQAERGRRRRPQLNPRPPEPHSPNGRPQNRQDVGIPTGSALGCRMSGSTIRQDAGLSRAHLVDDLVDTQPCPGKPARLVTDCGANPSWRSGLPPVRSTSRSPT